MNTYNATIVAVLAGTSTLAYGGQSIHNALNGLPIALITNTHQYRSLDFCKFNNQLLRAFLSVRSNFVIHVYINKKFTWHYFFGRYN